MFLTSLGRGFDECGSFTDLLLITMSPVTIRRWNTSLICCQFVTFSLHAFPGMIFYLYFWGWLLTPLHSTFQLEALRKKRSLLHDMYQQNVDTYRHSEPRVEFDQQFCSFPTKCIKFLRIEWKFARYGNEDYMESVDKRFVQATYICKGLFILKCSPCSVTVICISGTLLWLVYL